MTPLEKMSDEDFERHASRFSSGNWALMDWPDFSASIGRVPAVNRRGNPTVRR